MDIVQDRPRNLPLQPIVRVSTKAQTSGSGEERQETWELAEYASHNGFTLLPAIRVAETASGWDRPAFEQALKEATVGYQEGRNSGVVVADATRFSREVLSGTALLTGLAKDGVPLHTTDFGELREQADFDRMVIAIAAAAEDRRRRAKYTKYGRQARADGGRVPNGAVPYPFDYNKDTGLPSLNPERAEITRQMALLILREGYSLRRVSSWLYERGIPTQKGLGRWSIQSIRRVLQNEALTGRFSYNKTKAHGRYGMEKKRVANATPLEYLADDSLRVLSDEEFYALNEVWRHNTENSPRNISKDRDYTPLRNRVFCWNTAGHRWSDDVLVHTPPKMGARMSHGRIPVFKCPECGAQVNALELWSETRSRLVEQFSDPEGRAQLSAELLKPDESADELMADLDRVNAEIVANAAGMSRVIAELDHADSPYVQEALHNRLSAYGRERDAKERDKREIEKRIAASDLALAPEDVDAHIDRVLSLMRAADDGHWKGVLLPYIGLNVLYHPQESSAVLSFHFGGRTTHLVGPGVTRPAAWAWVSDSEHAQSALSANSFRKVLDSFASHGLSAPLRNVRVTSSFRLPPNRSRERVARSRRRSAGGRFAKNDDDGGHRRPQQLAPPRTRKPASPVGQDVRAGGIRQGLSALPLGERRRDSRQTNGVGLEPAVATFSSGRSGGVA